MDKGRTGRSDTIFFSPFSHNVEPASLWVRATCRQELPCGEHGHILNVYQYILLVVMEKHHYPNKRDLPKIPTCSHEGFPPSGQNGNLLLRYIIYVFSGKAIVEIYHVFSGERGGETFGLPSSVFPPQAWVSGRRVTIEMASSWTTETSPGLGHIQVQGDIRP